MERGRWKSLPKASTPEIRRVNKDTPSELDSTFLKLAARRFMYRPQSYSSAGGGVASQLVAPLSQRDQLVSHRQVVESTFSAIN